MSYSHSPMGTVTTVIWAGLPRHPEPGLLSSADGALRALGSGAAQIEPWTADAGGDAHCPGHPAQGRSGAEIGDPPANSVSWEGLHLASGKDAFFQLVT